MPIDPAFIPVKLIVPTIEDTGAFFDWIAEHDITFWLRGGRDLRCDMLLYISISMYRKFGITSFVRYVDKNNPAVPLLKLIWG